MELITTTTLIVLQLIFLEGILSIDNAAVLGAMVTPLPADIPCLHVDTNSHAVSPCFRNTYRHSKTISNDHLQYEK